MNAWKRERWGPRCGPLLLALALAILLSACTGGRRVAGISCGDRRLNLAANFYEQAKAKLATHYKIRLDSALTDAYHASQDSMLLARATRSCPDFDEVIRRQAIDLIKSNLLFQKLIVSTMRDQDPGVVVDLYGQEYREIFKSDIN